MLNCNCFMCLWELYLKLEELLVGTVQQQLELHPHIYSNVLF